MSSETSIPRRTCSVCKLEHPLTSEFWHKDSKSADGFTYACKECAKARARKWTSDNSERNKANCKRRYSEKIEEYQQYRVDNAEHIADIKREWRKANPEKVKKHKRDSQKRNRASANKRSQRWLENHPEWRAQYYRENADRIQERARLWYQSNKERVAERERRKYWSDPVAARAKRRGYKPQNPERHRIVRCAIKQRRRAREMQAEGTHTAADLAALYAASEDRCFYCGITLFGDYHVDHIQPLSRGGSNWPDNLACACPDCNLSKADKTVDEWQTIRGW